MPRSTLIGNRSAGRDRRGLRAYADAQGEVREVTPKWLQGKYKVYKYRGPLGWTLVVESPAGERLGACSGRSKSEEISHKERTFMRSLFRSITYRRRRELKGQPKVRWT